MFEFKNIKVFINLIISFVIFVKIQMMEKGDNSLIIILTASLLHEIHIAKSLLASYGISSYIIDENIDLVYGRSVFEGFKLKVNTSDKEKAIEILEELDFS